MSLPLAIGTAGSLAIIAMSLAIQRKLDPQNEGPETMSLMCRIFGHSHRTMPVKHEDGRTYQRVICKCGDIIASNEPGA